MASATKIAVVLTAFDKMSNVVSNATENAQRKLKDLSTKHFAAGAGMMATGAGILASLQKPIQAYADLEEANTKLSATMMDNTGRVDANFKKVVEVATQLGNKLPGATKDFNQLFQALISNGVKSESILQGVGKAAAYLAIDLKQPMEVAGEFAARMKTATGVADNELLKFFDSISRMSSMGIKADELQYSFSRSAGTLKMLGLQGLEASNKVGALYAMLIRTGQSGETVGTSMNAIIQAILDPKKMEKTKDVAKQFGISFEFFKSGKFLGIENMVSQFGKLNGLDPTKMAKVVNALTGGGQDAQALNIIIQNGLAGYKKLEGEINSKASLTQKINAQLGTLTALREAMGGTIENMMAAFANGLAPVLKRITAGIIKIADATQAWFENNPAMARFISMAVALSGAFFTLAGAIRIIQGIKVAMSLLNMTMRANPFILFASIAIGVISAIYANWDRIGPWFKKLWNGIKNTFAKIWDWIKNVFLNFTPLGQIIKNWGAISSFFTRLWDGIKNVFSGFWEWFKSVHLKMFDAGKNIVKSIWDGIKALANKPVEAIKNIVQKIRDHLPFSPAKIGPLRDIHRIRLVETIADTIKPAQMMRKMQTVANLALNPFSNIRPSFAMTGQNSGANWSGGGMTNNITINLTGGATKQDAELISREFDKLMKKYSDRKNRISF